MLTNLISYLETKDHHHHYNSPQQLSHSHSYSRSISYLLSFQLTKAVTILERLKRGNWKNKRPLRGIINPSATWRKNNNKKAPDISMPFPSSFLHPFHQTLDSDVIEINENGLRRNAEWSISTRQTLTSVVSWSYYDTYFLFCFICDVPNIHSAPRWGPVYVCVA